MPNSESFTALSEPTLNGNPKQEQQSVRVFPVQFDAETIGLLRAGYDVPPKFVPADSSNPSYFVIDDGRSAQLLPHPSLHLNEHNAKIPPLIFETQKAFDHHQLWHLTSSPQMMQQGGGNEINWTVDQKGWIQETGREASSQHHFDYDPSTASLLSQIAAQVRSANLGLGEPLRVTVGQSQVSAATPAPAIESQTKPIPVEEGRVAPLPNQGIPPLPSPPQPTSQPLTPETRATQPSQALPQPTQPSESLQIALELSEGAHVRSATESAETPLPNQPQNPLNQRERSERTDVGAETEPVPQKSETSSVTPTQEDSPSSRSPEKLPVALFSQVIKSLQSDRQLSTQLGVDPSRLLNLKLKVGSQLAWEGQYERGQVKQTFVDPEQVKKLQAVIPLLDQAEGEAVAGPNVSIKVNGKELFAVRDGKVVTNALSPQVKQQLMGISLEMGNEAQSTRTSGDPVTQKPSLVAFQQQQERKKDLNRFAQVRQVFRDLKEKVVQKETQPNSPQLGEVER